MVAKRRTINLPGRPDWLPFSDAVEVNGTVYLSGRIGLDPATGRPPADASEEARLLLDSVKAVLGQAGLTMDALAYVQVFCSDVSLFETFNQIYRGYFTKELPARAFIGSGPLLFGARFELQAIAVRRQDMRGSGSFTGKLGGRAPRNNS